MKILYIISSAQTENIVYNLRKLGYQVINYKRKQQNDVLNDEEIAKLVQFIKEEGITHLLSLHLIYNAAMAAHKAGIKYVSIIWDAPYLKMYTPMAKLDNCYFSVFDKLDCERFRKAGLKHILYQPLSVDKRDILRWDAKRRTRGKYIEDISFVGSIYDSNAFDRRIQEMPQELNDYFTSIMEEAAFKWDGVNRVYGKVSPEILRYMEMRNPDFKLGNIFDIDDTYFFEVMFITRKIANIERICILNMLAEEHNVAFYTNLEEDRSALQNVKVMPPVPAGEECALVFAGSKINLNVAIKGIEGGTPQRVIDILGAGGFALTNYSEETLEIFEEDKEIVVFKSPEELLDKVDYYLAHDAEREKIAAAGHERVINCYTYDKKLKELMEWVEREE